MRVLGIVPARGGSKEVPRKNIRLLRGKPLLAYTAEVALAASRLTRVVLSTDDPEIALVGKRCGLDVPFMRPADLAGDDAPMVPVVQHALRFLEERDEPYDAVLLLQPTNPLRSVSDIDGAIELLEKSGADSVISFVDVGEKHPARMKSVTNEGKVVDPSFAEAFEGQRRQELDKLYLREGSIYLTRTRTIMQDNSFKGRDCRAWLIPQERTINIDTMFDLFIAEQMLQRQTLAPSSRGAASARTDQRPHLKKYLHPVTSPDQGPEGDTVCATDESTPSPRAAGPIILVTESEGFSAEAAKRLRQMAQLELSDVSRTELLRDVARADVLWVRFRHRIDRQILEAGRKLKAIVTPSTGVNHIDTQTARRLGIEVLSLRGETDFLRNVRASAEHTLALMLSLLRRLPAASNHVVEGGWNRDQFKGRELFGKKAGIVGYGRLGRLVAGYLHALGVHTMAFDPHIPASEFAPHVEWKPLAELLKSADLVSLHVDLNESTHGFFGRNELALMKPGSWLINTARGELVDEDALLEALQLGHLAGAALDVIADELNGKVVDHPLVAYARWHDNLIITPHVGGCTLESMEKTERFMADKLVAILHKLADHTLYLDRA